MKIIHVQAYFYQGAVQYLLTAKTFENILTTDVFQLCNCDEEQEYGFFIVKSIEADIDDEEITVNLVPLNGGYVTKQPETCNPRDLLKAPYWLKRLSQEEGKKIRDGSGIMF